MPHRSTHPLALFSLIPINERAKAVTTHPYNSHLISAFAIDQLAIDVGLHIRSKSCNTLATLGRGDADILVEGSNISKIQCSFEIHPDTGVVMLYDRSHHRTTQVFGDNVIPFENERIRQVVVHQELNTIIGMGGAKRNLIRFRLKWHQDSRQTIDKVIRQSDMMSAYEENPRLARTIEDTETVMPSQRITRPHTGGPRQLKIRYEILGPPLGFGQFGTVHKALDVDSGTFMAVKKLRQPKELPEMEKWGSLALKREIEILSELSHPYIVDYISSQGWGGPEVEIFMGLKEGTSKSLLGSSNILPTPDEFFHQMLQALDYLASKGIIHRDIKPENILYETHQNGYLQFQLGDFGLSNRFVSAQTNVGTPLYIAPELLYGGIQTDKVDIWSLFVTMLWTLNTEDFRQISYKFRSYSEAREVISRVASNENTVSQIQEMAVIDHDKRASAAQMLVKCFDGKGLSTCRKHIPALINDFTTQATSDIVADAAAATPSVLATRDRQKTLRALERDANVLEVATEYPARKLHHSSQPRILKRPSGPSVNVRRRKRRDPDSTKTPWNPRGNWVRQ